MPTHGPPGDPHGTRQGDPFGDLLNGLVPAIGSAISGFNTATQPIRNFFDPVRGLGDFVSDNTTEILGGLGGAGLFAKGTQALGNFFPELGRALPDSLRQGLGITKTTDPRELERMLRQLDAAAKLQRSGAVRNFSGFGGGVQRTATEIARNLGGNFGNLTPQQKRLLGQVGKASAGGTAGVLANQARGFISQAGQAISNFRPPNLMPLLFYLSPQMMDMFRRGAEKRTS